MLVSYSFQPWVQSATCSFPIASALGTFGNMLVSYSFRPCVHSAICWYQNPQALKFSNYAPSSAIRARRPQALQNLGRGNAPVGLLAWGDNPTGVEDLFPKCPLICNPRGKAAGLASVRRNARLYPSRCPSSSSMRQTLKRPRGTWKHPFHFPPFRGRRTSPRRLR